VTAPDHQIIREVQRRLRAQQGEFEPRQLMPILDQVVGTVLSQHTSDVNSGRAFALLKARFPAWEQVAHAPVEEIEDAIRCGGLARQKARRIKEILNAVDEREGRIDLSRLHDLGDLAAEGYLTSLPGVGPKTAACVLAFSMGRAAFPLTLMCIVSSPGLAGSRRVRLRRRHTGCLRGECRPTSGTTCTSR
jgi:endonuclease-3